MKEIRILLSGNKNLQYYVDALKGLEVEAVAEYLPKVDTSYDGLILCGGNDIHPSYYKEKIDGAIDIDDARDKLEFALLKAYVDAKKPIMGICRGYQLINIFFGGSLYQDLPEADLHTNKTEFYITHNVEAVENSFLSKAYGKTFSINSSHHQAVKKLGNGLCAIAYWENKYIEAYEHTSLPIFGVQWHPERMCFNEKRSDTVDGAEIFKHFIEMCEK